MKIVINGLPESGKDEVVKIMKRISNFWIFNYSTVDIIKYIMTTHMGWDGIKNGQSRDFMAEFKYAWTKYNDGPYNDVINRIKESEKIIKKSKKFNKTIFFIHSREIEEIKKFKKELGAIALYINRHINYTSFHNTADRQAARYAPDLYDYGIENKGTLEDLENHVKEFLKWLERIGI
jgi:hypothetical protein